MEIQESYTYYLKSKVPKNVIQHIGGRFNEVIESHISSRKIYEIYCW